MHCVIGCEATDVDKSIKPKKCIIIVGTDKLKSIEYHELSKNHQKARKIVTGRNKPNETPDMKIIYGTNIPSKLYNSRHNLPWMNINLERLIRKKGRCFKKVNKSGMDEDRARYLDIEQMVKRELRDVEMVYVNGILQNGIESVNNKPFWKYVKSPKQETFGMSALKSNGNVITDSLSKAEILNS